VSPTRSSTPASPRSRWTRLPSSTPASACASTSRAAPSPTSPAAIASPCATSPRRCWRGYEICWQGDVGGERRGQPTGLARPLTRTVAREPQDAELECVAALLQPLAFAPLDADQRHAARHELGRRAALSVVDVHQGQRDGSAEVLAHRHRHHDALAVTDQREP